VKEISSTPQLRDIENVANDEYDVPLVIHTDAPIRKSGDLAKAKRLGRVIFLPIPKKEQTDRDDQH
jgi:hypothetical protein